MKEGRGDRPTPDTPSELEQKLDALIARKQERVELPAPEQRRALRKALGLTLHEVAALVGCSHVTVLHWEKGERTPQGDNRIRYRELLDALEKRKRERAKQERKERGSKDSHSTRHGPGDCPGGGSGDD